MKMHRYIVLSALLCVLLAGCRCRRDASPVVDVQEQVTADTSSVHQETTDSSRVESSSEGDITVCEDVTVERDSAGRPTRIVRRIDIRWLADLQSLIAQTSRSTVDSTALHRTLDAQVEQPAVVPEEKSGSVLDALKWIAIILCIYGFIIIVKQLFGIWKN